MLDSLGLLLPAFRCFELWRSLGAKKLAAPDGSPLPPPILIFRVAGNSDSSKFLESGKLAAQSIRAAIERSGARFEALEAILDFGCGCGRVLRYWRDLDARVCGADLNQRAVAWCRTHLPFAEVAVNGLEPPLPYPDATFDLVYALSVFTHLPVDRQLAWRDELGRVLRPGGYLVLSVCGDPYLDHLQPAERRLYDDGECVVRRGNAAGSNLCLTYHPPDFVRKCLGADWDLLEHIPRGALGNPEQDLVVLCKPKSARDGSQQGAAAATA